MAPSTGSANAQVVGSLTPASPSFQLSKGSVLWFQAGYSNTGPTTLAVSGGTAQNVFMQTATGPVALSGGEIQANQWYLVTYDGTEFQLLNPTLASTPCVNITGNTIATTAGVNAQTGTTYSFLSSDACKLVTFNNASSVAVSLVQAGGAGFRSNYSLCFANIGAGTVTITPTTSTINGNASLKVSQGFGGCLYEDGTNWFTVDNTTLPGGYRSGRTISSTTDSPSTTDCWTQMSTQSAGGTMAVTLPATPELGCSYRYLVLTNSLIINPNGKTLVSLYGNNSSTQAVTFPQGISYTVTLSYAGIWSVDSTAIDVLDQIGGRAVPRMNGNVYFSYGFGSNTSTTATTCSGSSASNTLTGCSTAGLQVGDVSVGNASIQNGNSIVSCGNTLPSLICSGTSIELAVAPTGTITTQSEVFYHSVQLCPKDGNSLFVLSLSRQLLACDYLPSYRLSTNGTTTANLTASTLYKYYAIINNMTVTGTQKWAGDNTSVELTLNAACAGCASGNTIAVTNVGGTTEANGVWQIGHLDDTHIILLGSAWVNAWTSGGNLNGFSLEAVGATTHTTAACSTGGAQQTVGFCGIETISSAASQPLVGEAYTTATTAGFVDSPTQRYVASYYNRRPKKMLVADTNGRTWSNAAAGTYVTASTVIEGSFVWLGGQATPGPTVSTAVDAWPVQWFVNASEKNGTLGDACGLSAAFNTAAQSNGASSTNATETEFGYFTEQVATDYNQITVGGMTTTLTEGINFMDLMGYSQAGTCTLNTQTPGVTMEAVIWQ
jgi:hypothetical protein